MVVSSLPGQHYSQKTPDHLLEDDDDEDDEIIILVALRFALHEILAPPTVFITS